MFPAVYALIAGQYDELPRRRDVDVAFEPTCTCRHEASRHVDGHRCSATGCRCVGLVLQPHDVAGTFVAQAATRDIDEAARWQRGTPAPAIAPAPPQTLAEELRALAKDAPDRPPSR